jgi:hypothetical protein
MAIARNFAMMKTQSLSPLTRGTPRFLRQGVKMKTPSQSPPYALRKGEKEFVSLDTNGF